MTSRSLPPPLKNYLLSSLVHLRSKVDFCLPTPLFVNYGSGCSSRFFRHAWQAKIYSSLLSEVEQSRGLTLRRLVDSPLPWSFDLWFFFVFWYPTSWSFLPTEPTNKKSDSPEACRYVSDMADAGYDGGVTVMSSFDRILLCNIFSFIDVNFISVQFTVVIYSLYNLISYSIR